MPVLLLDEFTGPANSNLAGHTPNVGSAWVIPGPQIPKLDGRGSTPWLNTGGVYSSNGNIADNPMAHGPSPMPDADYSASCVVTQLSAGNGVEAAGLALRWDGAETFYALVYDQTDQTPKLQKLVAGVGGDLMAYAGGPLDDGQSLSLKLSAIGTSLVATIDGMTQAPVVDADIAGPGSAGVIAVNGSPSTATTGLHVEQFAAFQ